MKLHSWDFYEQYAAPNHLPIQVVQGLLFDANLISEVRYYGGGTINTMAPGFQPHANIVIRNYQNKNFLWRFLYSLIKDKEWDARTTGFKLLQTDSPISFKLSLIDANYRLYKGD